MFEFMKMISSEIALVTLIVLAWLWFTCGPMVKSDRPAWERVEHQIVFCSLIIGLSSLGLAYVDIKGTVVDKFIVDNIINFKLTPMLFVNLFLCTTGVAAVALSQSPNKKTAKLASIFGLIGQPAWYALGVLTGSVGLLILSTLYTQAWWKGFNENWFKPWRMARRLKSSTDSSFISYMWTGSEPPVVTNIPIGTPWLNTVTGDIYTWGGQSRGWRRVNPPTKPK